MEDRTLLTTLVDFESGFTDRQRVESITTQDNVLSIDTVNGGSDAFVARVGGQTTAFGSQFGADTPEDTSTSGDYFLTDEDAGPYLSGDFLFTFDTPVLNFGLDLYDVEAAGSVILRVFSDAQRTEQVGSDSGGQAGDGTIQRLNVAAPSEPIKAASLEFLQPDTGVGIDNLTFENRVVVTSPTRAFLLEDSEDPGSDSDYNDLVMRYSYTLTQNTDGDTLSMTLNVDPQALGSTRSHGLGINLPGNIESTVTATRSIGGSVSEGLLAELFGSQLAISLSDDVRSDLARGATGTLNTSGLRPIAPMDTLDVEIDFASPASLPSGERPFELLLTLDGDRSQVVGESTCCIGTTEAPLVFDVPDVRNPAAPELTSYPSEGTNIFDAFPDLVGFISDNGVNQYWYDWPAVSKLYSGENSAPNLSLDSVAVIDEGESAVVTGSYSDPDIHDSHQVLIDWHDPNDSADSSFALPATDSLSVGDTFGSSSDTATLEITSLDATAGEMGFAVSGHVYQDDIPSGKESNTYSIGVMVIDDDGGRTQSVPSALAWQTTLASINSNGNQANGESINPSISADGRFVAFESHATNLVSDDTSSLSDIFVLDRETGETQRVSVDSEGNQANASSDSPIIAANGRHVAFRSRASNLVPGDTNGELDIFIHDLDTGETRRVSVSSQADEANDISAGASISANGRYVAFYSWATNLVAGDTNAQMDVFVHDSQTGKTERVSINSDGGEANGFSGRPSISSDGQVVTFESDADNLISSDTNEVRDIFVHDRATGQTQRISFDSAGNGGDDDSYRASISDDGRFVAFDSWATNLVSNDNNSHVDIFVHDRQTGQTARVAAKSNSAALSGDGRYVAFQSQRSNLVPEDSDTLNDIFVHDRDSGQTKVVSVDSAGTKPDGPSFSPSISSDGHYVAFTSAATSLVENDTNGTNDVFVNGLRDEGPISPKLTVVNDGPSLFDLNVDATVIDENGSIVFSGSFNDAGTLDTHEVLIDWGDGSTPSELELTGGERDFSATHQYLDDSSGTSDGTFPIEVTVTDDEGDFSRTTAAHVTVENYGPSLSDLNVDASVIEENGSIVFSGSFNDAGTLDTHDMLIDWGDGSTPSELELTGGERVFSAMHQYLDDSSGTSDGTFPIEVTVTDDEGDFSRTTAAHVTVENVTPRLAINTPAPGERGDTVLVAGSYSDPGIFDEHEVTVDWDDPAVAADSTFHLAATPNLVTGDTINSLSGDGAVLEVTHVSSDLVDFAVHHRYVQPGNFDLTVSINDGDAGLTTEGASVVVANTTLYWQGDESTLWSNPDNWLEGLTPVTGDSLIFDNTTTGYVNSNSISQNDLIGLSIDELGFGSSHSVSGESIILSGGIDAAIGLPGLNANLDLDLELAGDQSIVTPSGEGSFVDVDVDGDIGTNGHSLRIEGSGNVTLSGVVGGAGGLVHDGSGFLILEGENSYTGATHINAGKLRLLPSGDIADSSSVEVASGATATIVGTSNGDVLEFGDAGSPGVVDVTTNGDFRGTFDVAGELAVEAGDGDDTLRIHATGLEGFFVDGRFDEDEFEIAFGALSGPVTLDDRVPPFLPGISNDRAINILGSTGDENFVIDETGIVETVSGQSVDFSRVVEANDQVVDLSIDTDVGADRIEVGGELAVSGSLTMRTQTLHVDQDILSGGDMTLIADKMDLAGTIEATEEFRIHARELAQPIALGSTTDTQSDVLELSDAELDRITAGALQIGDGNSGSITVSDAISPAGTDTLSLRTGGGLNDGANGSIQVANLAIRSVDSVVLDNATSSSGNAVGVVAAEVTGAGSGLTLENDGNLSIGSVDGLTGITTNGGGMSITTHSPLAVDKELADTGGGNIRLIATDDGDDDDHLTVNASITATGGDGSIELLAGTDLAVNDTGGNAISTAGNGTISAIATRTAQLDLGVPLETENGSVTIHAENARVRGTEGEDDIAFAPGGNEGEISLASQGTHVANLILPQTGRIEASGGNGDDNLSVDSSLLNPTNLSGDDGHDELRGGGGTNVLDGGAGDDTIEDGGGTNTVIGGTGSNRFVPGDGDNTFEAGPDSSSPDADPPQLIVASDATGDENAWIPLTVQAALSDPAEVLAITISNVPANAMLNHGTHQGGGTWSVSQADLDSLAIQVPDDMSFDVTVTITSTEPDSGDSAEVSSAIHVTAINVAPVIAAVTLDSADIDEDGTVAIEGAFADAGTLDTHSVLVDWGDDSDPDGDGHIGENLTSVNSGSGEFTGSHDYAHGGIFPISVQLMDDDGGIAGRTLIAYVTGVSVQGRELQVVGTDSDDHLVIHAFRGGRELRIHADFLGAPFRDIATEAFDEIRVVFGDGHDFAHTANNIDVPVSMEGGFGDDKLTGGRGDDRLLGGPGNDELTGGPGDDVLIGGEGEDRLLGSRGRDLQIGGQGSDQLFGSFGDDILIAGSTDFDHDHQALDDIMAEWTSDRSYRTRVDNLLGGGDESSSRANGETFFEANKTVHDDASEDHLIGGLGKDLFFADSGEDHVWGYWWWLEEKQELGS